MEVAGLAISVAGLAGLFSACIDSYNLIQRGVSFDKDYKILRTKFDNQELRLYAWGAACGLVGTVQDDFIKTPEVHSQIVATLECVKGLFEDQVELQNKYGLCQSTALAGHNRPVSRLSSGSLSSSRHSLGTFFRRKKQERSIGLIGAVQWAIEDYAKFGQLIQHLKDLNDDLESFTRLSSIMGRQRLIVEYEVEIIEDLETLQDVEQAGLDDTDVVSDSASLRLISIREDSVRSLSVISSSTNTRDSASFHTGRSRSSFRDSLSFYTSASRLSERDSVVFYTGRSSLSTRERLSVEIAQDDLLSEIIDPETRHLSKPSIMAHPEVEALKLGATGRDSLPDVVKLLDVKFQVARRKQIPVINVLAVGPTDSNTTILLETFRLGEWPKHHRPNVFDDYVADCRVNDRQLQLLLVDTAGQRDYPALRKLSFMQMHSVLLCFRADKPLSESTYDIEKIWNDEVSALECIKTVVLVGVHDPDTAETTAVGPRYEKALRQQYAKKVGAITYLWCNPRSGIGVEDVFKTISLAACKPPRKSRLSSLFQLGDVVEEMDTV